MVFFANKTINCILLSLVLIVRSSLADSAYTGQTAVISLMTLSSVLQWLSKNNSEIAVHDKNGFGTVDQMLPGHKSARYFPLVEGEYVVYPVTTGGAAAAPEYIEEYNEAIRGALYGLMQRDRDENAASNFLIYGLGIDSDYVRERHGGSTFEDFFHREVNSYLSEFISLNIELGCCGLLPVIVALDGTRYTLSDAVAQALNAALTLQFMAGLASERSLARRGLARRGLTGYCGTGQGRMYRPGVDDRDFIAVRSLFDGGPLGGWFGGWSALDVQRVLISMYLQEGLRTQGASGECSLNLGRPRPVPSIPSLTALLTVPSATTYADHDVNLVLPGDRQGPWQGTSGYRYSNGVFVSVTPWDTRFVLPGLTDKNGKRGRSRGPVSTDEKNS